MAKTQANTVEEVESSIASIYSSLLSKRKQEKADRQEQKRLEKESKEQSENNSDESKPKLSKKEKREAEFDNWKEIIIGLTGEDLEYSKPKKSKKKYRKWIDDENVVMVEKPKKVKKRNYSKEFAPELQMLKSIVADQNKFTADLQKRFSYMAGPANKDAMALNKTMVDLASVINAGRSNSLGVLKEVGNLKKVIAELYFKQRKEDLTGSGNNVIGNGDLALLGSNIASTLFSNEPVVSSMPQAQPQSQTNNPYTTADFILSTEPKPVQQTQPIQTVQEPQYQEFDPATWNDDSTSVNAEILYENIPHNILVEMNSETKATRFKAVNSNTGEELVGCPIPTYDTSKLKINEKDLIAKGQFDETYKIEIV